jgi:hypothetical protein
MLTGRIAKFRHEGLFVVARRRFSCVALKDCLRYASDVDVWASLTVFNRFPS